MHVDVICWIIFMFHLMCAGNDRCYYMYTCIKKFYFPCVLFADLFDFLICFYMNVFFLISSDCLQLLVRCINPIFGTTEQEVLAPVHFFARLSSVLLKITISGVYELNSNFFQVCVIVLYFISSTICETRIL